MLTLGKYSIGTGDRFCRQGRAQLAAVKQAAGRDGLDLAIVWNKSHREHVIIGTSPDSVRTEADQAVGELGWRGRYFVDADHINLDNVDLFIDASDFFTIDVADFIDQKARPEEVDAYVAFCRPLCGDLAVPGIPEPLRLVEDILRHAAEKYLVAVKAAKKIYTHIEKKKGAPHFITEISMDEIDQPQTPEELLLILAAVAAEKIPIQTIAPRFSGRFNKGVDYFGDIEQFRTEFEADLCIVRYCVQRFGFAQNLKLSVHSGSDKFSIYPVINQATKKLDAGLHIKTAGTTWLEEVIGLALSGEEGLGIAKEIYQQSLDRIEELCGPYLTVIDIDRAALPAGKAVAGWSGSRFADTLRHDQHCPAYNPNFRQLMHVGYKIAAEMGRRYTDALEAYQVTIAPLVTENMYERHIKPVFL